MCARRKLPRADWVCVATLLLILHDLKYYRIEKIEINQITINNYSIIASTSGLVWIPLTTRNHSYRLDREDVVLGDGHAGVEPVLELVGPPGGGVPGVEPPPSGVAATLTLTRIELLRILCWFNFFLLDN